MNLALYFSAGRLSKTLGSWESHGEGVLSSEEGNERLTTQTQDTQ